MWRDVYACGPKNAIRAGSRCEDMKGPLTGQLRLGKRRPRPIASPPHALLLTFFARGINDGRVPKYQPKSDYVSSSESELGEEDRGFAEEMGLPTGDVDLQDSEHSSDEEGEGKTHKNRKRKAAAAAAAAEAGAKAAENSWMGGGGGAGRWGGGGGGGGGDQVVAQDEGKNGGNTNTKDSNNEPVAPSGGLAVEGGGGDEGQVREERGDAAEAEGRAEPAAGPTSPSVAGLRVVAAKVAQRAQEVGEYSLDVARRF